MAVNSVLIRSNRTSLTDRWLSRNVWADFPFAEVAAGTADAYVDGDDFKWMTVEDGSDDAAIPQGYQRYIDTSNTIRLTAATASNYFGSVALITDATDNDGPVMHRVVGTNAASSVLAPFFIGNTADQDFPLWFECRFKISTIADDAMALAIGLVSGIHSARAADNGLLTDDTGEIVDSISFLGFNTQHVNSGTTGENAKLDFVYQDGAQTTPVVAASNVLTMTADTWIKAGFYYNPDAISSQKISIYINNATTGSYVTKTNIDTATFPENDMMGFVVGTKTGSATATTLTLDWWKCAQLYSRM